MSQFGSLSSLTGTHFATLLVMRIVQRLFPRILLACAAFLLLVMPKLGLAMDRICEVFEAPETFRGILKYQSPTEPPQMCVSFTMKSWLGFGKRQGPQSFLAQCTSNTAVPVRGALPPCLTDDYVQLAHKSLVVAGDCFDVDPRYLIPKIKGESGFLHAAFGRGSDAGTGQLTGGALSDLRQNLGKFRREVESKRDRPSCALILKHWNVIATNVLAKPENRCAALSWPENPLKNTVLTVMFYRHLENLVDEEMTSLGVYALLKRAGLDERYFASLSGILSNLAYNSGSRQGVILLREFLNARLKSDTNPVVSRNDFNFKSDISWINHQRDWKSIPVSKLTFPGYVKIHMQVGHPGYLGDLMKQIYHLNNALPEHHLCSPKYIEGFLAL